MDYYQFVILFRSILQEGLFRPQGSIRDFLDMLIRHYRSFGGDIRLNSPVVKILTTNSGKVIGVRLLSGEEIFCDRLLSTIGWPETLRLLGETDKDGREPTALTGRLSFMESIYILSSGARTLLPQDRTIIFYNNSDRFQYRRPDAAIDFNSGVLCFPDNFKGLEKRDTMQLRVTHLANYQYWLDASKSTSRNRYTELKDASTLASRQSIRKIIGNFQENIVYEDSFTPLTIERFTSRLQGAVYGSPYKLKNGKTHYANLYVAGTDQGFLGIVGAMLSGVSIVNQHMFE
jgi:phytoene dehydrogenase-like protein